MCGETSNLTTEGGFRVSERQLTGIRRKVPRRTTDLVFAVDDVRTIVNVKMVVTVQLKVVEAHHESLQR